jgi:hypothetical protein
MNISSSRSIHRNVFVFGIVVTVVNVFLLFQYQTFPLSSSVVSGNPARVPSSIVLTTSSSDQPLPNIPLPPKQSQFNSPSVFTIRVDGCLSDSAHDSHGNHKDDAPSRALSSTRKGTLPRLKYHRELYTGLGDRFSVMIAAQAMARASGAESLVFFWYEDNANSGSHLYYSLSEIQQYVKFPSDMMVVPRPMFNSMTVSMPEFKWEGNSLATCCGYDGIRTLAYKTMGLPDGYSATEAEFLSAYAEVGAEWDIQGVSLPSTLPKRYVVMHVRGGDKYRDVEKDLYCTDRAVDAVSAMLDTHDLRPHVGIVMITDDTRLAAHFRSRLPGIITLDKAGSKMESEMRDLKMMMGAQGIIQHSPLGWSAFSSVIAMTKNIPMINTWNRYADHLLIDAEWKQGRPAELFTCRDMNDFVDQVSLRLQNAT